MTTLQMTAIRNLWEELNRDEETMTAREMALSDGNLDRTGDIATMKDGRKFFWNPTRELWVR